jgi:hypothetical protein
MVFPALVEPGLQSSDCIDLPKGLIFFKINFIVESRTRRILPRAGA